MKQPDVFLFNPTCEYAVANGNESWQSNRILQQMESDLATLPMFFADSKDIIIVDKLPSQRFLNHFEDIGFTVPNFVLKKEILNSDFFQNKTFEKLKPWGWSPAAHKLLSPFKSCCSIAFQNSPVASWKPEHRNIYSKAFALEILKELLCTFSSNLFLAKNLIPEICRSKEQIEKLLSRWGKLMIKAPWSSSGRGIQPITKIPIHEKVWEKLLGIVNDQGFAIVEPLLAKAADLAFQFEVKEGKISYLGISNFSADKNGQYRGNYLNGPPESYSKEIVKFINNACNSVIDPLMSILEKSELAKLYEGNFGVDTLIFWDKKNELKMHPCLEINVRQNMGLLSLHIEKLIQQGKKGMFKTYYNPGESFQFFKEKMEIEHPLKITSKKIESGFFALTDSTPHTRFGAYILI